MEEWKDRKEDLALRQLLSRLAKDAERAAAAISRRLRPGAPPPRNCFAVAAEHEPMFARKEDADAPRA